MRKVFAVLGCLFLLSGCGVNETWETVADEQVMQASAAGEIEILLPTEALAATMESENGDRIYLCDGYLVTVQTRQGGDLDRTLREISGFSRDALTVIETREDAGLRYTCVWSAAGEEGPHICRATILDDGNYHYAVTVMAEYAQAGQLAEAWNGLMRSFRIRTD